MRTTLIAAALAAVLVLLAMLTDIDVVKVDLKFFNGIQAHELDDLLVGLALIFLGLGADRFSAGRRQRLRAEAQKLKTLQATMRTVQDIVGNFLNNLLLFEMEVKAVVPPHSLDRLEDLTQETFQKLKALGDVELVRETPLAMGAGIEYAAPRRP